MRKLTSRRIVLHNRHSLQELIKMDTEIKENYYRKRIDSIYLYDKSIRKLLDDIGWAIAWKMGKTKKI